MPEFPIEKESTVQLDKCGKPKNKKFPFVVDEAALTAAMEEIKTFLVTTFEASPDIVKGFLNSLAVLFTGDGAAVNAAHAVDAIKKLIEAMRPKVSATFSASKCCPPTETEFTTPTAPELPTLGMVDLKASWETYPAGDPEECACSDTKTGKCRVQYFTLTWVITVSPTSSITFPITAQIDTVEVRSPCCCPEGAHPIVDGGQGRREEPKVVDKPAPRDAPAPRQAPKPTGGSKASGGHKSGRKKPGPLV